MTLLHPVTVAKLLKKNRTHSSREPCHDEGLDTAEEKTNDSRGPLFGRQGLLSYSGVPSLRPPRDKPI